MTATTRQHLVRRLPGPTGARVCTATGDGWRWAEEVTGSPAAYLDAAQLELMRARVTACGGVRASLPQLVDPHTALWPAVATPALLVDGVIADAPAADLEQRMLALGRFLATLHRVPVDAAASAALPRRGRTASWLFASPQLATRVQHARLRLAPEAPRLTRLARADRTADSGSTLSTLVHGRFSAAQCVPAPSETIVLGWRDAGIGDPARDLAFMLGELVEARAIAPTSSTAQLRAAAALATGYGDAGCLPIAGRVADRVLDHLALRTCVAGIDDGLVALLRSADRCVDEVLEAVFADAC